MACGQVGIIEFVPLHKRVYSDALSNSSAAGGEKKKSGVDLRLLDFGYVALQSFNALPHGSLFCWRMEGMLLICLKSSKEFVMQAVREILHPKENHVTVEIPSSFVGQDVEVIIFPAARAKRSGVDFSDLSGELKWSGDAVAEQRTLRDEW